MKILIVLFLTTFSLSHVISQNNVAEIFFNDGTSIEGYAELHKLNKIKFRVSLDDKPDIWTNLMVDKIIFYGFEMRTIFQYVRLKPDAPVKLLEVLVDEETKLFADVTTFTFYSSNGMNNGLRTGLSQNDFSISKIYVQKSGDNFPVALTGNFKRKAKQYFSNCDGLLKKLDKGEFRKSTAKDMVYYYIDYCSE